MSEVDIKANKYFNLLSILIKCIVIGILVFAIFKLYSFIDKTTDIYGNWNILPQDGTFITPDDIEAIHHNPHEMVNFNFEFFGRVFHKLWGEIPQFTLDSMGAIKKNEIIDWDANDFYPSATFYAEIIDNVDGVPIAKVKAVQFNSQFIRNVRIGWGDKNPTKIEMLATAVQLKNQMGRFDKYTGEEHKKRSEQSYLAYTRSELEMMKSFAGAIYMLSLIILNTKDASKIIAPSVYKDIKTQFDATEGNWILNYTTYYLAVDKRTLQLKNWGYLFTFIALTIFILVLIFHLLRPNLYSLIRKELARSGVTLTLSLTLKLMLTNWRFLLLPVKSKKTQQKIQSVCQKIRDRRISLTIAKNAAEIWNKMKDKLSVNRYRILKSKYRIASKESIRGVSLEDRRGALMDLIDAWHDIRDAKQVAQEKKYPHEGPQKIALPGSCEDKRSIKEITVDRTKKLMPPGAKLDFDKFSVNQLNRLNYALLTLNNIHPLAVNRFLKSDNIAGMLTENSKFMKAVLTGDKIIISGLLSLPSANAYISKTDVAKYDDLFAKSKIIVVGSGKILNKKNLLTEALHEAGAQNVTYFDPFEELGKIEDSAKKSQDRVVFLQYTPASSHKAQDILIANRAFTINFHHLNKGMFQKEIIEKLRSRIQY